jgi:ParB family transcriptional regulator, chromosome partitioning protein
MVEQIAAEQILSLPVGLIRANNIRQTFDAADLEEMAESIRAHGVISPLIVRPAVDGVHELVAGERRLRAAQLAEMAEVPVIVREYSDREACEVQLIENVQRKGLDACEEGAGYQALIRDYGYTAQSIAEKIGKGKRYVYQRLEIAASLIPEAKEALAKREITPNHVMLLSRLRAPEQQARALKYAANNGAGVPVKELDHWIKRELLLKLDAAPFDRADVELVAGALPCAECPKNSANAPELYRDVKVDCCTDPACYELKVQAHINREIKASGGDLVQMVKGWHNFYPGKKPAHVRNQHEYTLIGNKKDQCADQVAGIVVYGDAVGSKVQVCISPLCKKHKRSTTASGGYRKSAPELAKARAEKAELETARVVRGRIVDAILERAPAAMTVELMRVVAERCLENLGWESESDIRKRHPEWRAPKRDMKIPVGDWDEVRLVRFLLELSLAGDLYVNSWQKDKGVSKELQARAEAAGVDWAAIEKQGKGKPLHEVLAAEGNAAKPKAKVKGKVKAKRKAKDKAATTAD